MTERIHAYLDGELDREALTPAERAQAAAWEASLGEAVEVLRSATVPDLTERVMRGLPAPEPVRAPAPAPARPEPLWDRLFGWLWHPREVSFTFRPAFGVAGLAVAALAAVLLPDALRPPAVPVAEAPAAGSAQLYVQFRLEAPEASQVSLAGTFTGWEPQLQLRETSPGVWTALVPLQPGVHDYTFVVDGERWVTDPHAVHVEDDFGGTNSRLFLPSPTERT